MGEEEEAVESGEAKEAEDGSGGKGANRDAAVGRSLRKAKAVSSTAKEARVMTAAAWWENPSPPPSAPLGLL